MVGTFLRYSDSVKFAGFRLVVVYDVFNFNWVDFDNLKIRLAEFVLAMAAPYDYLGSFQYGAK